MGRKKSATNKTVDQRGYALLWMPDHRLADVRGYVYEHRIIAESKLGRNLRHGEIVHHIDGNASNNTKENIEIYPSIAHHLYKHRSANSNKKILGEPNPTISCECGCGEKFYKYDNADRPRRFISGHNMKMKHG